MRVTDHASYQNYTNHYVQDKQMDLQKDQAVDNESKIIDDKSFKENSKDVSAVKTYGSQTEATESPTGQMRQKNKSTNRASSVSGKTTLYSSTADLMAIANTESQETLRGIYVRLSFKLWSVRAAGVSATNKKAVQSAARSVQKVMGKVKGKIKNLQKEDELEKKAEAARKAKLQRLQQEIRRELAIKRKIRKNREQKDVADSYLESDGQYFVKGYRDTLPEEVLLEMELRAAGGSGTTVVDAGISVDTAIAMAGMDSAMGVDTAAAVAEISGVVVDVGL